MTTDSVNAKLPVFERYLSVWVILCIIGGVILGKVFPQAISFLSRIEVARVNLPVAVLIWLMIYPMMVQIDFSSILRVGKKPKGLAVTLVVNWLIKPFTMAIFAVVFLKYLFSALINPVLAKEYIAGAILLGAAPCTAMVFVWSYLTRGNPAHTLVQVAVNDLVILIAFVPIVKFLLGVNQIIVPYDTLIYSTILFVVVPLTGGYISRQLLIKYMGMPWFENVFLRILKPVTILGLLLTLILLFAFQGNIIIENPLHILLIAIPLTLQTYFIFAAGYFWARKWRIEHSIASPAALIGASNFFELSVAVAISLFGLKSGAALATVVGVLTEVPIMLSLVNFSNKTRHWFVGEEKVFPEEAIIMAKKKKLLWEKALIATDLSETSNEVVECVAKEGVDFTKMAKLIHIISVETAGGIEEALEKADKPVIEKQVEMLKSAGIDASYAFAYGIPSVEINRIINEEKYPFLVLGSHSKSMVEEILLGSVADSIISNLAVPALLLKCKGGKPAVCPLIFSGKILFLTDFSDNAKAAFEILVGLVGNYNPTVNLYHVQNKDIISPDIDYKIEEFNRIDAERLNKSKETLLRAGAKSVKIKIETGHAKEAIADEINGGNYNLVVMGTQGRGWIEEVFLGDIAHAVIRKSNTSLLLVPFRKQQKGLRENSEEIIMENLNDDEIRGAVRKNYGKIAKSKNAGCGCSPSSCCGPSNTVTADDLSLALGYSGDDLSAAPAGANMGLGCGNPRAIASLQKGETVLDLGSGGGFDCFLAARAVGDKGHVIGVDMTPEMVSKSRNSAKKSGISNIEFRLGEIENLPIADGIIDVIISNCVINLSPEKEKVFKEVWRVLKPGGRLAISDIVATAELPESVKKDLELYTSCVAGASSIQELEAMLKRAGFENIKIEPKDESKEFIREWVPEHNIEEYIVSASIRAIKPIGGK